MEERFLHERPENKLNEERETLIIASRQILKRSNEKCGKDEFFKLANLSLETENSKDVFENLVKQLIETQFVKLNVIGNRTY